MPTNTAIPAPEELTRWRLGLKRQACEILGIRPNAIRLRLLARASPLWQRGLFGVAIPPNIIMTRPRTGLITYVHEMLHLLFPRKPHSWIFGAAYILADRPERTIQFAIEAAVEIGESKARLMRRARAAAERKGLA